MTSRLVLVRAFTPERVRPDQVRIRVLTVLNRYMRLIKADFKRTCATWNHGVQFDTRKEFSRRTPILRVEVSTESAIWGWLNYGTKVRYRTMSFDFQPKTRPGTFESFPGRGRAAGWGQHPGIQARNWILRAVSQRGPAFRRDLQEAVEEGLRAAGLSL